MVVHEVRPKLSEKNVWRGEAQILRNCEQFTRKSALDPAFLSWSVPFGSSTYEYELVTWM